MGQALPNDLDKLLGGAGPVKVTAPPLDAAAIHCDGMIDIARLIPRAVAWEQRRKTRRSVLTR
jgi:hypothetical protein